MDKTVKQFRTEGLIVGTPTHWGNMSAQLKLLLDGNVLVFMGEKPNGFPIPNILLFLMVLIQIQSISPKPAFFIPSMSLTIRSSTFT